MLEVDISNSAITLGQLLNEVEHGNDIIIIRNGQAIAQLSSVQQFATRETATSHHPLSSRHSLRALQPPATTSSLETLQTLRQEVRY
jgi:antitoxin (DNA-binding transcriptional repressor) of toxin-antitoxin stability system